MVDTIEKDVVCRDSFILTDADGDPVTGESANITYTIEIVGVGAFGGSISKGEISGGEYYFEFTPTVEGTYSVVATHPTHAVNKASGYVWSYLCNNLNATADSILEDTSTTIPSQITNETDQIDADLAVADANIDAIKLKTDNLPADSSSVLSTIQSTIDAILDDTDALEADLKAYLDGIEDHIRGLDDRDLSELYTYLVNTKTDLTTEINANETKIDIIDGIVDSIVEDTGTTIPTLITNETDAIDSSLSVINGNVNSILEDTSTTIPTQITDETSAIDGALVTIGANVDSILDDTSSTLPTLITNETDEIDGDLDDIEGKIDAILEDTGTTIPAAITTSETNIRGADGDTLKTVSDQLDAITPNIKYILEVPEIMYIPESGSITYRVLLFLFDSDGNPEAPDELPSIKIEEPDGTSILTEHSMVLISTGKYYYDYVLYAGADEVTGIATATITEQTVEHSISKLTQLTVPNTLTVTLTGIQSELSKLNTDNTVYSNMVWENKRLTEVDIEYYSDTAHEMLIKTKEVRATYDVFGNIATKVETTTYE